MLSNKLLDQLEKKLGYSFANKDLLQKALLHPSAHGTSYEFFEFLGDRVLGLSVANILIKARDANSSNDVKFVAAKHARLVSTDFLKNIAKTLEIEKYLQHKMEKISHKVFADAVEAILGAIYLDSSFETACKVVYTFWEPLLHIESVEPKTQLQELSQSLGLGTPVYEMVQASGNEHNKIFKMRVVIDTLGSAIGLGSSKHFASKEAAKKFLQEYYEKK